MSERESDAVAAVRRRAARDGRGFVREARTFVRDVDGEPLVGAAHGDGDGAAAVALRVDEQHVALLRHWAGTTPAARESALAAVAQATRAASRLGADLLHLAELDRAPPRPHIPLQLDQVVVDAVREAERLRPEVPIRIDRLDEARLAGDELGLRQLVVNLLAIAQRYSSAGAEVTVALSAGDRRAVVTVNDRGPGIPADQLGRVFERFYSTSSCRGTGLGPVAIAREIARRHSGDIRASNHLDGGAAFTVELPLTKAAPESS